jgi:ABC-type thiamin/hydroxymethylpyrimidine transport system permease subunit
MTSVRSDESVTVCTKCGMEQTVEEQALACVQCGEPLQQEDRVVASASRQAPPSEVRRLEADTNGLGKDHVFARLTTALQWIFAAWIVFAGVGIAFRAIERSLLSRAAQNRFSVSRAEAVASDHRVDTFAYVAIAALVVTGIVFIVWFHRAYRKTRELGGEMRYSNGWAIGAWFIPIGWLWIPKKLANDIWWGTAPEERSWAERSALLTSWWLAWVFAGVGVRFFGNGDVSNVDDGLRVNLAALVDLALFLLAAVLALFVVRQVGQRLAARTAAVAALVTADAPPPATRTTPSVGADSESVTTAGQRRQPWRLIGATTAIVALTVGTVVVIAGTSGSTARTTSKPLSTAPQVVSAPTPADFDRHESHSDSFAISVPSSWTSVDLTAPDIDATLEQLRLTSPGITDYLDQQEAADARPSFYAMDTSAPGQTQMLPAQFSVQRIPTEGQSLNEGARQTEEALSASSDLIGTVDREKVELPAGPAQVLSFKFHFATPAGDAIVAKTVYMLVSGDSAYVIALGGADDQAQPNASTFEAIIRSLELTN